MQRYTKFPILPPTLPSSTPRDRVRNHVFPRRKTSDKGAKRHRRRSRRLAFLLFRSESIHVPASTIHIRRRKRKRKEEKRGRKISVAAASRERASKQARRIPTWKKILRNVGFVSHLASVFRNAFFINSHLNDFRLPSSALRPPRPFL